MTTKKNVASFNNSNNGIIDNTIVDSVIEGAKTFSDRLYALVRAGVAFRFEHDEFIVTIVAPGNRYSGVWEWDRNRKRVKFSHSIFTSTTRKGKRLPLPKISAYQFIVMLRKNKKNTLAALKRWNQFIRIEGVSEWACNRTYVTHGEMICRLYMPGEQVNIHVYNWLTRNIRFIHGFGMRRQRIIDAIHRLGVKKGLRSMTKLEGRTINSLANGSCYISFPFVSRYNGLDLKTITTIWYNKENPIEREFAKKLGRKYGSETVSSYINYYNLAEKTNEYRTVLGIPTKPVLQLLENKKFWDKQHSNLRVYSKEYAKVIRTQGDKGREKSRERCWGKFKDVSYLTPLVKDRDFIEEKEKMHHCIDSYAVSSTSLCAHVSIEEVEATLEISYAGKIKQLFSFCNTSVPNHIRDKIQKDLLRCLRQPAVSVNP